MPEDRQIPLAFPAQGLDTRQPHSEQPPMTTSRGVNVRLNEMIQLRDRGGQRSGLSRYIGAALPGVVQELNTVVHVDEEAMGAAGFEEGDPDWTTLAHAGTYVLGSIGSGFWQVSEIVGVTPAGAVLPGTIIEGTPVGGDTDQLLIPTPIDLPAGTFVLAYWQPGAFQ